MFSPSATFRKMRSPQMIGVDPLHAGISTFQAMFVSGSHSVGRFVSVLTPLRAGPRQFGQFSPAPPRSRNRQHAHQHRNSESQAEPQAKTRPNLAAAASLQSSLSHTQSSTVRTSIVHQQGGHTAGC